jgi:hypothetical protein
MTILNLASPLSSEDTSIIAALCGRKARRVVDVAAAFSETDPLAPQVRAMLDGLGFSSSDWQNQSIVLNLPPDPVASALIVAEIAGRRGRTPSVVRWKRTAGATRMEPAEVISLHEIRKEARHQRKGWSLLGGKSASDEA